MGNGVDKNLVAHLYIFSPPQLNTDTVLLVWCWIGPDYRLERLAGEFVWMWTALFASSIMYPPLYF
jgi:hypothetical protein